MVIRDIDEVVGANAESWNEYRMGMAYNTIHRIPKADYANIWQRPWARVVEHSSAADRRHDAALRAEYLWELICVSSQWPDCFGPCSLCSQATVALCDTCNDVNHTICQQCEGEELT